MSGRTWWAVALVLGGLAVPARAAEKLEWKFEQGKTFYVKSTSALNQTLMVMNKEQKQEISSVTLFSFRVDKKTDTSTVLVQKIESVTVKGSAIRGGSTFEDLVKGAEFTITLGPDQKLAKFEGYDQLVKRIEDASSTPTERLRNTEAIKSMLPQETFEQAARQLFDFLPDKPVAQGDKWQTRMTLPMASLGSIKAENTFTLREEGKAEARIDVASTLTYVVPAQEIQGFYKVTQASLRAEKAGGTIIFDVAKGRPSRFNVSLAAKGTLTLEVRATLTPEILPIVVPVSLEQNRTVSIEILDKNPAELKDEDKKEP